MVRMLQERVQRKKSNKSKEAKPNSDTEDSEGAWMMEHALTYDISAKNDDIILDTGATNHVFHDRSLFHSIFPIRKSIFIASGLSIPVHGVGQVKFRVYEYSGKENSKVIKMGNVWYVPSCTKNLVSGSQLVSKGFKICYSNGGLCVLSSCGKAIASARPKGRFCCFNTDPHPQFFQKHPNAFFLNVAQGSFTELLHQRFAHIGLQLLKNIDVSELQPSIIRSRRNHGSHINTESLRPCEVCSLRKQVEKINRGPLPKSSDILELIHSDTWGKCRTPGIFGSLYYVTLADECSRETTLYLMKNKSDVPHYYCVYKEIKDLQTGRAIKAMRFDGGSEYKTIDFHGITKQICAPYTQHQNGVSERLNRTLITMTRFKLSHAFCQNSMYTAGG
ncbi:hypothetical protein K3495_g6774 [Podosphaera aphanis]|nr:hypothetical protein K3495_g6774 [Podosphaera aphanis]